MGQTLLRMKARGQATGASSAMHTRMIQTVFAPNLWHQHMLVQRADSICAKASLIRCMHRCISVSDPDRGRQGVKAYHKPCRLQKA